MEELEIFIKIINMKFSEYIDKNKYSIFVDNGGIGILHTSSDKTIEELKNILNT